MSLILRRSPSPKNAASYWLQQYPEIILFQVFLFVLEQNGFSKKIISRFLKQLASKMVKSDSNTVEKKNLSLVQKGTITTGQLQNLYDRFGFGMESFEILLIVQTESGDVVTIYLQQPLKSSAVKFGPISKPFVVSLEQLFIKLLEFICVKAAIPDPLNHQPIDPTTNKSWDDIGTETPTNESWDDIATETPTNESWDVIATETPTNESWDDIATETPTNQTSKDISTESLTEKEESMKTRSKRFQMCALCNELVTAKKFFGERRFAILENCDCIICYGCIRKVNQTSNCVVKGPVKCGICSSISDNVASSALYIEGSEKVEFFNEYRDNFLNKMLTPMSRSLSPYPLKDDIFSNTPIMVPVN